MGTCVSQAWTVVMLVPSDHPFLLLRNTRAPMPELVLSSSNSTSLVASPPAVILQAPMRILKRPTASLNSGSNLTPQENVETLAEREVRYQAARERIFGGEEGGDKKISGKGNVTAKRGARGSQDGDLQGQVSVVNVVRNPLGPTDSSRGDGSEQTSKGFKSRAGKGPAASMQGPV